MAHYSLLAAVILALAGFCYTQSWHKAEGCTQAGNVICDSNCSSLLVCMGDGDGGFINETVEECAEGTYCYEEEGVCSSSISSCQQVNYTFECTSPGDFPDPFNCSWYYVCVNSPDWETDYDNVDVDVDVDPSALLAFHTECEEGSAYNASRYICNLPLNSRPCVDGVIPSCKGVGQIGAVTENPSIYYVCHRVNGVLVPYLYNCPRGGIFNEETFQCEEEGTDEEP